MDRSRLLVGSYNTAAVPLSRGQPCESKSTPERPVRKAIHSKWSALSGNSSRDPRLLADFGTLPVEGKLAQTPGDATSIRRFCEPVWPNPALYGSPPSP